MIEPLGDCEEFSTQFLMNLVELLAHASELASELFILRGADPDKVLPGDETDWHGCSHGDDLGSCHSCRDSELCVVCQW